ncbi:MULTISPECIES: glycosyl hydrolase family 8 [unclassified Enterococcus]|uniref:glycosyl hydrolase family 8 n=1 Tax=unclassified Enterococcus TaxID=2608891 RepID=UPI001556DA78|nr:MULTISPECIES: glycosyl hydrolase family 8 [unclassified Enterococcus]MBS7576609.1 licheninase [Enterococcus sp. MMGLQ5-2]MBS7583904.1 licheninase [Enterococcus sp. MMGLQ5-1]NPD11765.1 licheninase [Enterococcus sp. MMGLQ5-1]NPD36446.1 licheninase [Enterococcus sp. MMGLQ5-2]
MSSDNQEILSKLKVSVQKWRQTYLTKTLNGVFVNSAELGPAICVSEGQGYGMLITVKAALSDWCYQSDFDLLVAYYLKHRISPANPLMSWRQAQSEFGMVTEISNQTNATDGDMDIAYALFLAAELWGDNGRYNYFQLALEILNALLQHCFQHKNKLLMVGAWAKQEKSYDCLVRSSDLNLHYFAYFYQKTLNEHWLMIKEKSEFVLDYASRLTLTGLISDFLWVTAETIKVAKPNSLEGPHDNAYYWNANRLPWRLSTAANLVSGKVCSKMLSFFEQQPIILAGYQISGIPLVTYSSPAFFAPVALAALRWSNNDFFKKRTFENVLNTKIQGKYYADSINLLVLLEMLKES